MSQTSPVRIGPLPAGRAQAARAPIDLLLRPLRPYIRVARAPRERRTDIAKPQPRLAQANAEAERSLIALVKSGDRAAFGLLVERHLVRALSLAFRVLHHREDSEDLVQDAFLSALEHIDAFDTRRAFWPWLARIIVNRGLDLADARAVRYTEPLPNDLTDTNAGPDTDAERREILARFRHELALLPPRQQLVLQLHELDGYAVAEIAEMMGGTETTVRWHLHTGRQRMRTALAPLRQDSP